MLNYKRVTKMDLSYEVKTNKKEVQLLDTTNTNYADAQSLQPK